MTNNAPTWRSTEDLVALLAAVDREGRVEAARAAVTAAQADRDAKRRLWDVNRGNMAGITIDVPGASEAMAALKQMESEYRAADRVLADAKTVLKATERAVTDMLHAIAEQACRAAAQRIVEAAAEIESAASIVAATKDAADTRRLPRAYPWLVSRAAYGATQARSLAEDVTALITPPAPAQPRPTVEKPVRRLGGRWVQTPDGFLGYVTPGTSA